MVQTRLSYFAFIAAIFAVISSLPRVSSAQYVIPSGVIGNGGAALTGNGYSIDGTVSQSVAGSSSNTSDINDIGFWYLQSNAVTGVRSQSDVIPEKFLLFQNYPNPFNPSTTINYQLHTNSYVTLKVYDILGREVVTIVNEKENTGSYSVKFDGSQFASGVYFYRLTAGSFVSVKKLTLLK